MHRVQRIVHSGHSNLSYHWYGNRSSVSIGSMIAEAVGRMFSRWLTHSSAMLAVTAGHKGQLMQRSPFGACSAGWIVQGGGRERANTVCRCSVPKRLQHGELAC